MDLGTIFAFAALLILVGVYIARPFLKGGGKPITVSDRQVSKLQADKDRILSSLQELELDHAMDKLVEEDYRQQREIMVAEGANILRSLDEMQGIDRTMEPQIEDEIEAAVRDLRASMTETAAHYCGVCGRKAVAGDKFCVGCGSPLFEEVEN